MKKRLFHIFCGVFLYLFLINYLDPIKIQAEEEKEIIRVGFFLMSGYHEIDKQGDQSGYGYDYLQEVAKLNHWELEYVNGTWNECLQMLDEGKIDIMTCAQWNEERGELFDYTNYRMGVSYAVLSTLCDNDRYNYNDFKSFDGMKIGLLSGNKINSNMDSKVNKYNINVTYNQYSTEEELSNALKNHEIDAILTSNMRILKNEKVIAQFDPEPFFGIVKKGNDKVLKEFDEALETIYIRDFGFESYLYDKYFSHNKGYSIELTNEEKEYLKEKNFIKAVGAPDRYPLSYYENGVYKGIVADIMKVISNSIGIEFQFVEVEEYEEALSMVQSGEADLLCNFFYDYTWEKKNNLLMTTPYLDVTYSAITRKQYIPTDLVVAVCDDYYFNIDYINKHYNKSQIKKYMSEQECLEAVREGKASITFMNSQVADALLLQDENVSLTGRILSGYSHGISIAVKDTNDKVLFSIMNRAVNNLKTQEITEIQSKYTLYSTQRFSFRSFLYHNVVLVVLVVLIISAIIVGTVIIVFAQKKKLNRHILDLAYYDTLTKISNMHRLEELGEKILSEHKQESFFLLSLDISHFTIINENYGRRVGDETLIYVASGLNEILDNFSIVARVKGDQFLVLKPYTSIEEVHYFIDNIRIKLNTFVTNAGDIKLNYNCGVYLLEAENRSISKALDMVEVARKTAKNSHLKTVFFNEDMENRLRLEKEIEDTMEFALGNREFKVYYQPKYNMRNEEIVGAEALVRWDSPKRGFMNPGEFIPIFEGNGFIVELDFYVLEQVCKFLKGLIEEGKTPLPISINQSRLHFNQENYINRLDMIIDKYNIPKKYIELEVTESILANTKDIKEIITNLKKNGFYISVDDFGSGYSSLNMLNEIPIDILKIDKEFFSNNSNDNDQIRYKKVIKKVVELARELEMDIICEGVEYEEQAHFLLSIGCLLAQGYLYARPMPEEKFYKLLNEI